VWNFKVKALESTFSWGNIKKKGKTPEANARPIEPSRKGGTARLEGESNTILHAGKGEKEEENILNSWGEKGKRLRIAAPRATQSKTKIYVPKKIKRAT